MKSAAEQNEIAKKYRDLFKAGPAALQMKAVSRRADLRTHMQGLKEEILSLQENNLSLKKEIDEQKHQSGKGKPSGVRQNTVTVSRISRWR